MQLLPNVSEVDRRRVAMMVTGVEPEFWLTTSEALAELENLGVRTYAKKLSRLAKKAELAPQKQLSVAMNAKGESNAVDSPDLTTPIAIIDVQIRRAIHFRVSRFRSELGHQGDSH
jgi:hypothetical protein